MTRESMITKKATQIFLMICDVILIIIMSLMFHISAQMTSSKVVYVPKGSVTQIITYLQENNFAISKNVDKYLLYLIGQPQSGWINVRENVLTRGDFFYKLSHAKAAMKALTLIPGETTIVFLQHCAKEFHLSFEKLSEIYHQASPYKEGLLVPDTYNIPMGISEKHLIYYLVHESEIRQKKNAYKIFGEYNKEKWYKYLIVASIIQKESANKAEMPIVSSVIYNRLRKGMKLQMDGALKYGLYSHQKITPQRIKEDKTKYNTYRWKGLPDKAVCSVSMDAIAAAIFPKKTKYLYFVKNNKGVHSFSETFSQHKRNVKKLH